MSLFGKKPIPDVWQAPEPPKPSAPVTPTLRYGIADAITLMRTLPAGQDGELVIRVVRATLASLNVRLPDIIADASRKQKTTQDRIESMHAQVAALERKLEEQRNEIKALEADLRETTDVKARLEAAEQAAAQEAPPTIALEVNPALGAAV